MREIKAFLAVADELHFGRAAQRLHITTGAVSQAIRSLERHVGAPLFARTSRRVELTVIGTRLLESMSEGYGTIHDGVREAQRAAAIQRRSAAEGSGPDILRVAASSAVSPDIVTQVIADFAKENPGCTVVRYQLPGPELIRWLANGKFETDVFIGWFADPDNGPRPLPSWVEFGTIMFRRTRGGQVAPDHPLAGRTTVDVEELADYEVLRAFGDDTFSNAWVPTITPGGRAMRLVQMERIRYMEEFALRLAETGYIHLHGYPMPLIWGSDGIAQFPITGMGRIAVGVIWEKDNRSPWIRSFDHAASLNAREP